MCLQCLEVCFGGGPPRHHPGPGGPGGPGHHPGGPPWGGGGHGGPGGGYGNPIADIICCPCGLVWYICYAFQEIGNCFCGLGNCFGYDRRPGYGPPHHHRY